MAGASKPLTVPTKQQRIAELARQSPEMGFTSLAYFIDIDWLQQAYHRTRKRRCRGRRRTRRPRTTRRTWRATSNRCWTEPNPARTRHRPCGERTFPRQARLARPARWEFRPLKTRFFNGRWSWCWKPSTNRTSWTARTVSDLAARRIRHWRSLWQQTMAMGGGWILDVDIRKFFDTIDHGHLRAFLKRRVRDGVLLRLIGKWLQAGVLEDGCITHPEAGIPQGGVISPLLSNLFLHYVLDQWFAAKCNRASRGNRS